ncbi:glycosyl transferase [Rhodovulum viride]|uniref:Peptide O-xylosyltransferase n=1 Tax=Rhodovulum viride TaxID=1231134 RepID=A0ABX9DE77_9RHOB|nr:beta-1,6-N-acetylglucosaminyltransferase [Rhodovulum viride]RAP40064.1 glycosyl transferase [Rhodovulum viride]
MSVGFVMIVHTALDRAAAVARHWAEAGCPVVIHVDSRVPEAEVMAMQQALAGLADVRFCARHPCEWGTWSIVRATLAAVELALAEFPAIGHVYLASGACLPLRPAADLTAYLAARPETDFIESVTTDEVPWTVGGLSRERFSLSFPFAWKRQRRLFDQLVTLQRRLGIRRCPPAGLEPHLGSQWWCLTRRTLSAILTDPDRRRIERYFRRVWIPDESYFQTLVRRHGRRVESRSLTLTRFNRQGRPFVFYDDHLQLLRRSDCFVARKIWPGADWLYDTFLDPGLPSRGAAEPDPARLDRLLTAADDRRVRGRPGLVMQSRLPSPDWAHATTCAPFSVLQGFDALFEDFAPWFERHVGARVHGHLFAPDRAEFAGGGASFSGGISDAAALRDYDPGGFLRNLIWAGRGERQCFMFGPADRQEISWPLAIDRNAHIAVATGAWAVPLFRSGQDFAVLRKRAAELQRIEAAFLDILRAPQVRARVRIWSMADAVRTPMEVLLGLVEDIAPEARSRLPLAAAPRLVPLPGFGAFLQRLKNEGMLPHLVGDFPVDESRLRPPPLRRPYLVM